MPFKKIDRKRPDLLAALANATVFTKFGTVQARLAVEGENIDTDLKGGAKETTNTAKAGDWIVTNPDGEMYIIGPAKFESRYEPTAEAGVYKSKGSCRAIVNPDGEPVEIMASWGKPQSGGADCMVADTCNADGSGMGGEPYLIDADVFRNTYRPNTQS